MFCSRVRKIIYFCDCLNSLRFQWTDASNTQPDLNIGVRSDPNGGEFIDRDSPTFDYTPHATYLRAAFVAAILYFGVTTAIKISVLLMYRRIFSVDKFRRQSLVVGAISVVWWLAGTIATIVSCIPVNRLWVGPSAGGYCFNFNIFWMTMGGVELVIDLVILIMPVRMILALRLSRQQKVLLVGIFLLGGLYVTYTSCDSRTNQVPSVIITGLVRVVLGYKPGSQNVAFSRAELWSAVHVGIAVVCACLPVLRPFLITVTRTASSIRRRLYGSNSSNVKNSATTDSSGPQQQASGGSGNSKNKAAHVAVVNLQTLDHDGRVADTTQLTRESTREMDSIRHSDSSTPRIRAAETGDNAV